MYERIPFTLGYEALKLLGKGMYSNLWAALSEAGGPLGQAFPDGDSQTLSLSGGA